MSPKPQTAQLREIYVTDEKVKLRDWHGFLYKASLACAIALILGSYVSLQWATYFIGLRALPTSLPGVGYFAILMSFIVPLAIEGGMAIIASAFTTIPTGTWFDTISGTIKKIPKWLLVLIFSFLMALAQAANIGHAVVATYDALNGPEGQSLPPQLPLWIVYVFAMAFAALFPLGGSFMVYVAGFIKTHGVGAGWIEEGTEKVLMEVGPTTPANVPARQTARAAKRAEKGQPFDQTAPDAPHQTAPAETAPARSAAVAVAQARTAPPQAEQPIAGRGALAASRTRYRELVHAALSGGQEPGKGLAADVRRQVASEGLPVPSEGGGRKWVQAFVDELNAVVPATDRGAADLAVAGSRPAEARSA